MHNCKAQINAYLLQHALKIKSGELDTMVRRNILLQDVVKKLQVSNRHLLDKVHELQHEKEGEFLFLFSFFLSFTNCVLA